MITFDLEPEEITWLNAHKQSGTPEQKSNMFTRAASDCGANAKGGHGFQPGNTCAKENGDNSSQEYKPVTAGATVQEGGFGGMREGFNLAAPGGARVNGYLYDADFGNKSSSKTRGELFFIEVPKDQRRNGLATSLATDAIRLMQRNGAKTVSMHPMQPGAKELNARLVANGVLGKIVDTTESGKVEYEIIDTTKDTATKELEHGSRITIPASHTYGEMPVEVRRDGKYVTFVYDPGGVRESKLITFDEDEAKSFLADLRGELPHQPNSGNKILDSAIENKAELLGHGQGGIVFDGGDKIIKAASRIPYHWNNGLRTQEQANAKLQSEINIVNTLQDKGIPGLLPLTPVMHEGRLFAIRDKVSMDGLDQQAIDDAGDAIEKMHNAGFIMRDQVQIGMGDDGKFRFYDVGEAAPYNKEDMYAKEDKGMDHSSLARVADKAGLKYIVPDDRDAGLKLEDAFTEAYGAVEGDSIGNLMNRRLGLKIAYDRVKRQEPGTAELYSEAYDELLAAFRRRHNELSEAKKQGNTTQKSIRPSTLFTRAASGCGANTDGGHGFQPGNTCASGGDGKQQGESKPKNPGLRRKLAEAFYGTKQDHKQILDMADPAHASASDLEDPEKVKRIKEMIATPEERQQHQKVLQKVLDTLPPKMADRISKNVRDVKLCGSPEMVGVLAGKGTKTNSVFGFYRPGSRELVMDGGPDQQQGADEKSLTQTGIYAHELAHAADKIGFHRTFSETESWKQAFQSEIDNDQVPLSNYARVNRQEGFAEFVRLMVTNPNEAKTKFPKCSKAVQSAYGSF